MLFRRERQFSLKCGLQGRRQQDVPLKTPLDDQSLTGRVFRDTWQVAFFHFVKSCVRRRRPLGQRDRLRGLAHVGRNAFNVAVLVSRTRRSGCRRIPANADRRLRTPGIRSGLPPKGQPQSRAAVVFYRSSYRPS